MTLDQWKGAVSILNDAGVLAFLVLAVFSMWKGWVVPKRETDDLRVTIQTQAATINLLETANDRLLDEIAKPLTEVLTNLPSVPRRPR